MFVVSGFVCLCLHFSYHVEYVLCGLEWRCDVGQGVSFFCVLDRGGSAFLKGVTGLERPSLPPTYVRFASSLVWAGSVGQAMPGGFPRQLLHHHPTPPGVRSPKRRRRGPQRPGLALLALHPQASPGLLFPLRPGTMAWKETGSYLSEPLWGVVGSRDSWSSIQLEGVGNMPLSAQHCLPGPSYPWPSWRLLPS